MEACRPEMEASWLASLEASTAAVATPRRALATLVSTSSGVISDVEGALVHHRLEAVVGCHGGQRGVDSAGWRGVRRPAAPPEVVLPRKKNPFLP